MSEEGLPVEVQRKGSMQVSTPDHRSFNPDRDLVWCLPRIVGTALRDLGTGLTGADLRREYSNRLILVAKDTTDEALADEFQNFAKQLAVYFNAVQSPDENPEEIAVPFLRILFPTEASAVGVTRPRLLICDLIMRRMLCELPYWIEQVRPGTNRAPMPHTGEITEAIDALMNVVTGETE